MTDVQDEISHRNRIALIKTLRENRSVWVFKNGERYKFFTIHAIHRPIHRLVPELICIDNLLIGWLYGRVFNENEEKNGILVEDPVDLIMGKLSNVLTFGPDNLSLYMMN